MFFLRRTKTGKRWTKSSVPANQFQPGLSLMRSMNKSFEQIKGRAILAFLAPGFCGMMLWCLSTGMSVQAGEAKPESIVRFDALVRNDFFAGMMGTKRGWIGG